STAWSRGPIPAWSSPRSIRASGPGEEAVMEFDFTPEQHAFRRDVRAWLAAHVPADLRGRGFAASRADRAHVERLRQWQRQLHRAGYVGIDWPTEHGGRGASIMEQIILYEEMSRAEAPQPVNRGGL